jgi:type VI secretion system protein ImpH
MGLADLERFLPTGRLLAELLALVRNYLGDELEWDLNLVLRREEVPALRLGGGARLGWTTWLGGAARERDADDLTLRPLDYPRVRRDAFTPTTATPTGGRP